ncbi:MAG: glycosyltransferase family 39 protein [Anaerolineae bacterium]|nr:glycosyltransferase family 39 protein [Gemmatimonadaceae bacterium]
MFWSAVAGLLVLHVAIAWILRQPIGVGNDDAIYLQLSRSLQGLSYREEYLVGAPWHSQYPPGYPMILAMISAILGERLGVILALSALISAGALFLVFDATRRLWSPVLALMVLAVCAVNPSLIQNAGEIATETSYMAFSALALWFSVRKPESKTTIVLAIAAAIFSVLIRSAGVPLLAAFFFAWLIERRFQRAIVFAAATAVFVGSWLAWTVVAPQRERGRSYVADATALIKGRNAKGKAFLLPVRIGRNARAYVLKSLPSKMNLPVISGTLIDNIIWLLVMVACIGLGSWMIWQRQWRLVILYLLLYAGLLVLWSWPIARFLDPILPFVFLALLLGAWGFNRRFLPRFSWAIPIALTAMITVSSLAQLATGIAESRTCDRANPRESACFSAKERAFLNAAQYAKTQTEKSARFVSSKEGAFSYHTGRELVTIATVYHRGAEGIIDRMHSNNVSYVALGTGTGRERVLIDALHRVCDRLEVVQLFPPQAAILRVLPGSQTDQSGQACGVLSRPAQDSSSDPDVPWSKRR